MTVCAALLAACAATEPRAPEPRPVYPPPPDPPRVQFLASFSGSGDVEAGPSALDQFLFGEAAEAERPIQRPVGVIVRDGVAYALDAQLLLIHRIDIRSQELEAIVPSGRAQLRVPTDLHLGDDGMAYVADRGRRQVLVFDRDWNLAREFGPWDEPSAPVAATTWQDRVYVADPAARCVRVVDRETGAELGRLGDDPADHQSALRTPTGLATDDEGFVYVVDAIYQRVLVFDRDLAFVAQIGEPGDEPGFFGRPKAVATLDRTVWVLDSLYENCQILDKAGKPLMWFGGGGTGPGNLYLPRGIWIGTDGLELFADRLDPGFVPERLIAITSFYGPRKISFFALGRSELPQFRDRYHEHALPERPIGR
ncbi:MAG: hypothetical protein AB7O97_00505 [Planctomycetota bacterium]